MRGIGLGRQMNHIVQLYVDKRYSFRCEGACGDSPMNFLTRVRVNITLLKAIFFPRPTPSDPDACEGVDTWLPGSTGIPYSYHLLYQNWRLRYNSCSVIPYFIHTVYTVSGAGLCRALSPL